jgi:hypothetical protein
MKFPPLDPKLKGDPWHDHDSLFKWLVKCDMEYTSMCAFTEPSRASTTVRLIQLAAFGQVGPDVALPLIRKRVKSRLEQRRAFPDATQLEVEFETYPRSFSGCRTEDDYISVIASVHAAPAVPGFTDSLKRSGGGGPPPTF